MTPPFIGIAGNIGVGKTTFTEAVAKRFDFDEIYESVIDNPYLEDFYNDMERWSFNLQVYFLYHRFSTIIKIPNTGNGVIQDRTIYEDVEIFSQNLKDIGAFQDRDWNTYKELFKNMTSFIKKPDLIIYLRANTDTLITRIEKRNREYEKKISAEYLLRLNLLYDRWIDSINDIKVMKIDTVNFNIFKDKDQLNQIFDDIIKALGIDE